MDLTPAAPTPEDLPTEEKPRTPAPAERASDESAAADSVSPAPAPETASAEGAQTEDAVSEADAAPDAAAAQAEPETTASTSVAGAPTEDRAEAGEEASASTGEDAEKKSGKKKDKRKKKDKDKKKGKGKKKDKEKSKKKDKSKKRGARKGKKKARRRPPPRHVEPPLPPELKEEAAQAALQRVIGMAKSGRAAVEYAIAALKDGRSIPFLARFRRTETGGMDERALRNLRDGLAEITRLEERRTGIRALLKKRGALNDESAAALEGAETIAAMEDLAAPFLPVSACRATMARGHGLQGLADAIRAASDAQPLSEMAKGFVPEGSEPTAFDVALGGARDILAEELSLDPRLRARLRALFLKEGVLRVSARNEKRRENPKQAAADVPEDAVEDEVKVAAKPKTKRGGRGKAPKGTLVGFEARAGKVPPMKMLAIRRAEKMRQVVASIEPPEEKAIAIVHRHAVPNEHPHAGLLRAAAEDGYRRILKPMLQNEIRLTLKHRADEYAMEQFERSLRNLLLGPYAGARRTLGLRPDVMNGHRWCVVDEQGNAAGSGTLPHEPTAGREACLTELVDVLKTYDVGAIAVGTSGGRADALALAHQADKDIEREIDVTEVPDGGTRALESMGPMEFENHLTVGSECRGALSLARRFQDPLRELILVDPKALALGPHLHEVHQGHLRTLLDDVVESCVAHVGVDPNTAGVEMLTRLPGFNRRAAQAFLTYRGGAGPLKAKAELAAIDGVGPKIAEQAVGFLRLTEAEDPRDRTQLHPEQYAAPEKMAEQVGSDLATLFSSADARKKVQLDSLVDDEITLGTLKHALYEVTSGHQDPRPRFTQFIAPPASIKLQDLASQPNLMLQGRVIRAAPFGLFLDVGMGVEALIPIPHIGDRPGLEPSTVAPVGAVISARVLEVEPQKRRLTLSMRRPTPMRGGRGPGAGGRPQRGGDRAPRTQGDRSPGGRSAGGRSAGERRPAGAGAGGQRGGGGRSGGGQAAAGGRAAGGRAAGGRAAGGRSGGGQAAGGRSTGGRSTGGQGARGRSDGRTGGRQRKPGRFEGGSGFGGGRTDRNTPRSISLQPDDGNKGKPKADESKMSPDELMAYKLEQMKRKLQRPDA